MPIEGLPCDPEGYGCPLERHYRDLHHRVPRWLGRLAQRSPLPEEYKKTVKDYIAHPMNHVVGCRWIHATELDPETPSELPPLDEMQQFLMENRGTDQ